MEFLKQFTAELFCSALVYDQLPQLAYILWFWHHPTITYSSPMAWMQPVGHNIERKIVDYWSTAELNPVESKVFILKSFLWNRIRIWTGLCLEFMDCLLILQLFESKMILAPFLKIFGNIYKPEIIFGSFHDKITSLNFLMGLPVIILCSFSLESLLQNRLHQPPCPLFH